MLETFIEHNMFGIKILNKMYGCSNKFGLQISNKYSGLNLTIKLLVIGSTNN